MALNTEGTETGDARVAGRAPLLDAALTAAATEADPWFAVTAMLDIVAGESGSHWVGVIVPEHLDQPGYKILACRDPLMVGKSPFRLAETSGFKLAVSTMLETGRTLQFCVRPQGSTPETTVDSVRANGGGGSATVIFDEETPFRSGVLLPLAQGGEPLGALCLLGAGEVGTGAEGAAVLPQICNVLSLCLRNLVLSGQLERQELFGRCSEQLVARIAAGAPEQELYEFLAGFLGEAFGADVAAIGVLSDDREWLLIRASHDPRPGREHRSDVPPIRLADDQAVADVVLTGGLLDIHDLTAERIPESWRAIAAESKIESAVLVPLSDSGGVWGAAMVADESAGSVLGPKDRQLFRVLVQHAAPLLQNSRIMLELRHSVDGFKLLFETSREVSSVLNMSEVPRIMARRAMELSQSDEGMVLLLDPDGRKLRPVLALSEYEAEMMKIECTIGEGISGHVAMTRVGEYVNRVDLDPRSRHIPGTPVTPEALLAVPLVCADKLIGVMSLYKLDGRQFNDLDLATITIFATQAAIAIENARLFERVAAERSRLLTMIQQMEEAVFFCDAEGTILVVNSAAQGLTGREEPLAGGSFPAVLPQEMQGPLEEVTTALRSGTLRNITRELQIGGRYILGSFTAIRDERNEVTGLVVLCKDITDLKAMESQLLQSSKMSAVGQLATGVAHEFNNLIAAIYGYAQFMKDNRDEKILKKGIGIILNSSERARDLTRSLLTFSRNSEGRFEAVDLNEVINDAVLLVEQQLIKTGIKLVREYDRLPHAWADRGRLQEVFLNLISNARHAMPEGGTLTLATRPEGDRLVAEVIDTGHGIPPQNLGRIFDPFFTTKGALGGARTPGTGLGLFTVYNTVTAHGGTVEVTSTPEKGTHVRVLLPARAAPPGTTRQENAAPIGRAASSPEDGNGSRNDDKLRRAG